MKSLVNTINEGKTNPRDIEKSVKSWVTNCLTLEDYLAVLKALCRGWQTGISENQKYYKDDYIFYSTNKYYKDDYRGGIPKEVVDKIDDDLYNKWNDLENYAEYSKYMK